MLQLEPYKTKSSRVTCPACGHKNAFARYIDDAGQSIDETVGRCNREVQCGYHLRPREYFAQNPATDWTPKPVASKPPQPKPPLIEIPASCFEKSQKEQESDAFVAFLLSRYDHCDVMRVCEAYGVGGFEGFTTFWRKDTGGKLWTAKLIKYDAQTGKRRKDLEYSFDWMHALLKRRGVLPEHCDYRRVFFGAHLLTDEVQTIALVEAEKTAVIAALKLPEYSWLACGGRTQINAEKLRAFANRRVMLFPDGDSFDYWSTIASEARARGANVVVSDLLETELTPAQKADGYDLADYFLMEAVEALPVVIAPATSKPVNQWAEIFAGHCRRCGDYLQPDGSCELCRRPLPF